MKNGTEDRGESQAGPPGISPRPGVGATGGAARRTIGRASVADTETNQEKRKSRYCESGTSRPTTGQPLLRAAVLIKRAERQAHRGTLAAALQDQSRGSLDRHPASAPLGPGGRQPRNLGTLPLVRAQGAGGSAAAGGHRGVNAEHLHHCSVGCAVTAEVANGSGSARNRASTAINRSPHCAEGAAVRDSCMATGA